MKRIVTDDRSVGKIWFVRQWAMARLGRVRHERRVSRIAAKLFEITQPRHSLTRKDRQLLKLAALVHDIGRCANDRHHAQIGAEMILDNTSLPLTRRERRALAYLTLHHRGPVPSLGRDHILHDSDDRHRLIEILALLRAADGLDNRTLPPPELNFTLRRDRLSVICRLGENSEKARHSFTRKKKFRLLSRMLGIDVQVDVVTANGLPMAA